MGAEVRYNYSAEAMIAAPFAVNPARLTDEARARFDCEMVQGLIAERIIKGERLAGHFRCMPTSEQPKGGGRLPSGRSLADTPRSQRILAEVTDEWRTARQLADLAHACHKRALESLLALVAADRVEMIQGAGRKAAVFRRIGA